MTIYIAADHTGIELKRMLIDVLSRDGHSVTDIGASTHDSEDDYPDFILPCAAKVAGDVGSRGIIIGGSGHGEAMAANRVPGVRAATFYGPRAPIAALEAEGTNATDGYDIVRVARMHNDANILSLGARFISSEEALAAVRAFIDTSFSGDARHLRRIGKF